MNFLKKNWISFVIALIFIGFLCMVYVIRQQNLYEKNPGLIPPRNNYDVKIELNDQEKAKLEEELKKYDDLIQNFVPATGQQEVDL
ncbi:TPA: hypothetical protein DIC40_01070 [Patescibacteria group bacterium]|nr:hypothetical protein [Candidatus Gracilibacteria bacterium]